MAKEKSFSYPAKVVKDGDFRVVSFRDIPEALTQADKNEDLNFWAEDALKTAIEMYMEDGDVIPSASKAKKGEVVIDLPPSFVAKIILHNAMVENRYRQADIAKSMGNWLFINLAGNSQISFLVKKILISF